MSFDFKKVLLYGSEVVFSRKHISVYLRLAGLGALGQNGLTIQKQLLQRICYVEEKAYSLLQLLSQNHESYFFHTN
jgi:hypothetical protein